MATSKLLTITRADTGAIVGRPVAGIIDADRDTFVSRLAHELGAICHVDREVARTWFEVDVGVEVECKPVGIPSGNDITAQIEIGAWARYVARLIAPAFGADARKALAS